MTENKLKTLKEIEIVDRVGINFEDRITNYKVGFVGTTELKREAIKWIKQLRKCYDEDDWTIEEEAGKIPIHLHSEKHECNDFNTVERFIMHFFNIEESDLK